MSLLRDYKLKKMYVTSVKRKSKQWKPAHLCRKKIWQILNSKGDLKCKFPICSELPSRSHSLKVLLQLTKSYKTNSTLHTLETKWKVSKIQTSQCAWLCLNNHFNINTLYPRSQFSTWGDTNEVWNIHFTGNKKVQIQ